MKDNITRYAILSVGVLSFGIIFLAFCKYIFPVILPFGIAWIVAAATASPARALSKRIKAPENIIRLVMSVLGTLIFVFAVLFVMWRGISAVWSFLSDIGQGNRLYDLLASLFSSDLPLLGDAFPPELASRISEAVGKLISGGLTLLGQTVTSLAGAVPQFFFFILVTLISLVYFALDYNRINSFAVSILPDSAVKLLRRLRDGILTVIKKYILSYSLIMLITYFVLLIGLWLLRVDHALILALLIALLDILPILGVGTVLVPWSIFELVMGNKFLGIGLILLFVVSSVIRQISEPKIVGKSLNLHPIITLMMLYVGYALFGFAGLLLGPVIAVAVSVALKRNNATQVG